MRLQTIYISLLCFLPICLIVGASLGAFNIEFGQTLNIITGLNNFSGFTNIQESVLLNIRLPRVLLSMLVGSALAVSGAGMQGLFRNPLADPGLIGISAGAVLAAAVAILLGWQIGDGFFGYYGLSLATFIGAIITTWLVFKLAKNGKQTNVSTMLLAGVAINALAGAATGFIIYLADDDELRTITFWSLGSLGGANWNMVFTLLPLVVLPIIMIPRLARKLDAFALGEIEASCLGVNIQSLKNQLIIWVTLAVGSSVAMVGMIGFIGLVVPHIARLLVGAKHKNVFVISAILGAIVLCVADVISRLIVAPAELPIGIITALLGTPLFLFLLIKQKKRHQL